MKLQLSDRTVALSLKHTLPGPARMCSARENNHSPKPARGTRSSLCGAQCTFLRRIPLLDRRVVAAPRRVAKTEHEGVTCLSDLSFPLGSPFSCPLRGTVKTDFVFCVPTEGF